MTASAIVAEHEAIQAVRADSPILARRNTVAAIAIAGLLAAVGGGLLLATSDHLVDPTTYGLQVVAMTVGAVAATLYWFVRRPGNRLGFALLALAVATAVISLQGATQPLLHSIGV